MTGPRRPITSACVTALALASLLVLASCGSGGTGVAADVEPTKGAPSVNQERRGGEDVGGGLAGLAHASGRGPKRFT